MGKQSKRKNKRRSGGGGGSKGNIHPNPTGLAADDDLSTTTANTGGAAANIIKKIRHGDPRVRHAALVALSSTLFDSTSLSNAAKKKKRERGNISTTTNSSAADASNPTLLRALSEKILDVDIPCATVAVGCLSNYVSFYFGDSDESVMEEENSGINELEVSSEVMVPILLRRIQTSLATIQSMGSQMMTTDGDVGSKKEATKKKGGNKKGKAATTTKNNSNAMDKQWSSLKEQWSLLSLSLLTLAGLIENCPKAVRRLGATAFPQLLSVLPMAADSLQLLTATKKSISDMGKEGEPIADAVTNAARALHSLLDDNATLIRSLPLGTVAAASITPSVISAVTLLTNTIKNLSFSDITRLHAAGSILSLRRVLVLEKETGTTMNEEERLVVSLQSSTNDVVVPTLCSLFDIDNGDDTTSNPKQLLSRMMTLSRKISTIKQDERMESQIEKEVKARKEPARDIARRQKKTKEEKKKNKEKESAIMEVMEEDDSKKMDGAKEDQSNDATMVVEEEEDEDGSKPNKEAEEGDLKQELDDVVQSWKDLVGSHKLALELVANLCSGGQQEEGEEGDMDGGMMYADDDDEHMWDSDDEAKLMASAAAASSSGGGATMTSPYEQATYDSVASNHLPELILVFFRKWVGFLPAALLDSDENTAPALVSEDVDEILSTCALCLGNVVAMSNLPTWSAPPAADAAATSKGGNSNATIKNGLQWCWWELGSILNSSSPNSSYSDNYESKSHVASVMLSLLRSQPESLTLVDSPTLDCLLALLLSQQQQQPPKKMENNSKESTVVQMHCHIIAMLGVLCCSEEQRPTYHSSATSMGARVCRALLERLRSASDDNNHNHANAVTNSTIVTHEILNVLMDIYGDDDEIKEEVFRKEDVLGHFQRCLPGFKRRVKKVAATAASGPVGGGGFVSREEVDVWSEAALNASRFIKYKKGR